MIAEPHADPLGDGHARASEDAAHGPSRGRSGSSGRRPRSLHPGCPSGLVVRRRVPGYGGKTAGRSVASRSTRPPWHTSRKAGRGSPELPAWPVLRLERLAVVRKLGRRMAMAGQVAAAAVPPGRRAPGGIGSGPGGHQGSSRPPVHRASAFHPVGLSRCRTWRSGTFSPVDGSRSTSPLRRLLCP